MRELILITSTLLLIISGCCKEKLTCKSDGFQVAPFVERYSKFECQNNNEYTYIFKSSSEIESLRPTCFFTAPIAFPIDESNMVYFLIGKGSYNRRDTFSTSLLKDTCNKTLIYQVDKIQRDTATWDFPGGVQSMFCAVENIPSDYKVEVKYKYVPLP